MKREPLKPTKLIFLAFFLLISLTILVSAASLWDIADRVDSSIIVYPSIFIIIFALLFFSLSKAFKGEKTIAVIISLAASILIVYGLSKSNFDAQRLVNNIASIFNISSTVLLILFMAFIILAAIIYIIVTLKNAGRRYRR